MRADLRDSAFGDLSDPSALGRRTIHQRVLRRGDCRVERRCRESRECGTGEFWSRRTGRCRRGCSQWWSRPSRTGDARACRARQEQPSARPDQTKLVDRVLDLLDPGSPPNEDLAHQLRAASSWIDFQLFEARVKALRKAKEEPARLAAHSFEAGRKQWSSDTANMPSRETPVPTNRVVCQADGEPSELWPSSTHASSVPEAKYSFRWISESPQSSVGRAMAEIGRASCRERVYSSV